MNDSSVIESLLYPRPRICYLLTWLKEYSRWVHFFQEKLDQVQAKLRFQLEKSAMRTLVTAFMLLLFASQAYAINYEDSVLSDAPVYYWRLGEADKSDGATADNLGSTPSSCLLNIHNSKKQLVVENGQL